MSTLALDYATQRNPGAAARAAVRDAHAPPAALVRAGGLHPAVLIISAMVYVLMFATFWLGFFGPMDFGIAMGINTVTLTAFIGLPMILARTGKVTAAETDFSTFLRGYFDTNTGPVSGTAALALVITVPVCLCAAAIAMAVIFNVLR